MRALVLFVLVSMTMFASGIDGKWRSEREVGDSDGKTYSHVTILDLKSEGNSFTGTVVWTSPAPWMKELNGKSFDVIDGKVDGEKYTFKVVHEDERGSRTSIYEGKLQADQMKGVVKFRGIGQTWDFDAKRMDAEAQGH